MQHSLVYDKNNEYCTWNVFNNYDTSLKLFLDWEMHQKKVVEKINTHFMFSNVFPENRTVY
jgi:hypothetical protein